ncbi:MAG TPA: NAD(+)/NADH kinase [Desulfobacterales bacterium]|nr:NAD(+)/NADH kinase [Desulfobacterales bacterium]
MTKRIGLVVKKDQEAVKKAAALEAWLKSRGCAVVRKESSLPANRRISEGAAPPAPADLFCVFVLGGDGTFLSAVRWIGDQPIPILGVKFGEVGFLAEITEDEIFRAAERILAKAFSTQPRMRLLVCLRRQGREVLRETVLNDIVINKGALARLANIRTSIDDHYLTTFRADGLIISTPTGSTAYSLAAGGPVVHPDVPGILITPICPFTLTNRPRIVPENVCITLQLDADSADIMLTFDGQAGLDINGDDTIVVTRGVHPVLLITLPGQNYFDILKAKLRWSGGRV